MKWAQLPIGEIFSLEKGSLQSSKASPGKYTFITAAEEWKTHKTYTHDCEALVYAVAASGSLGRAHYVKGQFVASDLCFIMREKDPDKYPVNFKFYQFLFGLMRKQIVSSTKTGTSKEAINQKNFSKYPVPYIDIDHQNQWQTKLSNLSDILEQQDGQFDEQSTYLNQLRQAILQEAIEGKLTADWRSGVFPGVSIRPSGYSTTEESFVSTPTEKLAAGRVAAGVSRPGDDASALLEKFKAEKAALIAKGKLKKEKPLPPIEPGEVPFALPEGWVWTRLGAICHKVTDGFHHTPKKLKQGAIYISATHIRESGINWKDCLYISKAEHDELYRKAYPQKGEILITNRGAGCGTPAIIDTDEQFSFQNTALIGFNQELVSNKYVRNFIILMREQIMAEFVNGGLQPMLSNVVLRTIPIPLPPLAEQHAIVERVDKLLAMVDQLEQQVAERKVQAEELMQAVLREAFG
jgi:type I restriction enzyme, S subunit